MSDKVVDLVCGCGSPIFTVRIHLEGDYAREVVSCATCEVMLTESTGMRSEAEEWFEI